MPGVKVIDARSAATVLVKTNADPDALVALICSPRYPAAGADPDQLPYNLPESKALRLKVRLVVDGIGLLSWYAKAA